MLAKEGVGILSLRTKCRDRDEHKRVIHSENKCMASLCDFCVFGIWSRSPGCMCTFGLYAADRWRSFLVTPAPLSLSLSLSPSLYPAENLSRVSSHRVLFYCYRNNHCAGLGMCFFKKWLPTRNLSLRYIILPWFYSYLLTLPRRNSVVWKRGSDLTSRTRCLSYKYEGRVRE